MDDRVERVANAGWDARIVVCRCAPTVDSFIVVTTRYVVFVDTLLNPATAQSLLAIARPYLRDGRTPLVINTHADWDHCWGNQLFAGPGSLLPAPIIAHAKGIARYGAEMDEQLRKNRAASPGRFDAVVPTAPTITFADRLAIDGGDLTLELFSTPGHTEDHLAIMIPEIETLLAGDAVEDPFPFAYTPEGLAMLRGTLRDLAARRPRAALYCHAPFECGPALIERNMIYFDALEARCRAAFARVSGDIGTVEPESWAGWTYQEAVGTERAHVGDNLFYRDGHRQHIAIMAQYVQSERVRRMDDRFN